jgi:hypothetical protein
MRHQTASSCPYDRYDGTYRFGTRLADSMCTSGFAHGSFIRHSMSFVHDYGEQVCHQKPGIEISRRSSSMVAKPPGRLYNNMST